MGHVSASALDPVPTTATAQRLPWDRVRFYLWVAVLGLSAYTATHIVRWIIGKVSLGAYEGKVILMGHVLLALPCILTGPFLFMERFRDDARAWIHRWLGYLYVVPVLISAVLGFWLAIHNTHGPMAQAGFSTLAIVWFSTTAIALAYALKRDWLRHRRWVLRSYVISLAVITVRFIPPPFGMTKLEWYPYMTWVCWVPNAILGETYVRMTGHKGALIAPAFLVRLLTPRRAAAPTAERS